MTDDYDAGYEAGRIKVEDEIVLLLQRKFQMRIEINKLRAALRELLDAIDGPVYSAKRAEEARARAREALGE